MAEQMDLRSKGFAISAGVVVGAAVLYFLRSPAPPSSVHDAGATDGAAARSGDASADGGTRSYSNQIVAFDVESGREKWRIVDDTSCDVFSPDSAWIACSLRPGRNTREDGVLDVATGKRLHVHPGAGHGKPMFSAKSTYYLQNEALDRWSVIKTDTGAAITQVVGYSPAVAPDESLVIAGREVHSLPQGELVATLPASENEPRSRQFVGPNEIAETRGGGEVSITVTFYDAHSGRELRHWQSPPKAVARVLTLSPTGRHLVVDFPGRDRAQATSGTSLVTLATGATTPLGGYDVSSASAFSEDGSRLVFTRRMPDDARRVIVRTLANGQEKEASDEATALGHAVVVGPDKKVEGPPSIHVIEPGGKQSRPFNDTPRRMRSHLLSPDGKTLVIQSWMR